NCPYGGVFYKCSTILGGFTGCCLTDPCLSSRGGCPEEKDRTPDRYTPSPSTGTTSSTVVPQDPSASFVKLPISIEPVPPASSNTPLATSSTISIPLASSNTLLATPRYSLTESATLGAKSNSPGETAAGISGHHTPKAFATAMIVSAIIGGIVFISLGIFLWVVMRRKNRSVYQAPIYVSPFNTSSDV
ncbi:hypothetical protein DE146DRAFT_586885, partial [Phaeosphaeria sp. MPI-PUGE-AT-0046c]